MLTIKDIAKKSGYGISTVSRALNNHPDISEETKRKILEVVEENQFELNSNAKRLKQRKSSTISIIIKGAKNSLFSSIIEVIEDKLKNSEKEISVHYIDETRDEVLYAQRLYRERKPNGIIFLGGTSENFEKNFEGIKVPSILVTLDASQMGFKNLSSVCLDDREAASSAIQLLIDSGHKNIGLIVGDVLTSGPAKLRLEGCKKSLLEHGLEFNENMYEVARFSFQSSYRATCNLLDKMEKITAIFCMSDVMAVGTMRALRDKGKSIPNDISVIGFDGIDLTSFCIPRLYTVKQDTYDLGTKCVEILLESIDNKSKADHYHIPHVIVEGESIKKLNNNKDVKILD